MKNLNIFTIVTIVLAVFLAGCTTNTPPGPTTPTGPVVVTPQCSEYCPTLPHIQCVGRWNISGTYPSCSCDFVCDVAPSVPSGQPPQGQNTTQNPPTTTTPPTPVTPPPAVQPEAPATFYTSLADALSAQIDKQKTDFYKTETGSGRFGDSTQYWNAEYDISAPNEIPIVSENLGAPALLFDRSINRSERAFAFTNFTQDGVMIGRRGLVIFLNESEDLDTADLQFGMDYSSLHLRGCRIYDTEREVVPPGNRIMKTYYFGCESATTVQ